MFFDSLIATADSYKHSHPQMLPPGTTEQSSYIEARSDKWSDRVMFFGLQAFLHRLSRGFDSDDIVAMSEMASLHGIPFDKTAWFNLLLEHGGQFPVEIQAVPEGTVVPVGNVLVQIRNTDPKFPWVTSFLETALLRAVWYPSTVATNSWHARQIIGKAMMRTCGHTEGIDFKLHDFGARGVSSGESAALGGMAHLVNFKGTDTVEALFAAKKYYNEPCAGFSIPASEHSVMTSWGGREGEPESMANILNTFLKPGKIVACVSDSYNIRWACSEYWGRQFVVQIKESGGTLVVRPDSGDPTRVPIDCVEILWDKFGGSLNDMGLRVLHPSVRVIQGDGITHSTIGTILQNLEFAGFSAENIAFGMGGGLLQQVDRDTLGFAMKCSEVIVNGQRRDVFKQPIDQPDKYSKRGRLALVESDGSFKTIREDELNDTPNVLRVVYANGQLIEPQTLSQIRERAAQFDTF